MKKLLYVLALSALLLAACGETEDATTSTAKETPAAVEENVTEEATKAEVKEEAKEDDVPREFKNALTKAEMYAETMAMSDSAVYEQLISDFGEKFTPEEAQYAVDNL